MLPESSTSRPRPDGGGRVDETDEPLSRMRLPIEHVEWFAARWGGARDGLIHLRDGANSVYEFQSPSGQLVLRVTANRHRTREQLEAELDFIRFVASRGVRAARPLPSTRGATVETLQDESGSLWHATVFSFMSGRHFQFFSADVNPSLFRAWGSAMGKLHAASCEFVPGPGRRRPSWADQDSTCCDIERLPATESAARREHGRVMEWLASLSSASPSWGLIHGDFERTNFVIDRSGPGVYDFDDACYHWYVADIAHALWAFRNAPPRDRKRFLDWFILGYAEHRPIPANLREEISWLVRLRSLSLFIHRYRERPTLNDRWSARMRVGFETQFWW